MSGDERDPTDEEVAASQKLRDGLDEDPIAKALKAAWAPEPISAEAHEEIVDAATADVESVEKVDDDPLVAALKAAWAPAPISAAAHQQILDDMPTLEEIKLAAVIEEDEMLVALKAAWNPSALSAHDHERIIERALGTMAPARSRLRVAIVTTTTVFALAAGVVLFLQTQDAHSPKAEVALAKARSTQPLFDEPFHAGETSARIDKIAIARASDYRDNYFAKRGVK